MSSEMTQEQIAEIHESLAELGLTVVPAEEQRSNDGSVDTVSIKMQLIQIVKEINTHNQGVDWEVNKTRPKPINVKDIISDAQKLFEFVTSEE